MKETFSRLSFYGTHKKAVSSVKIAPPSLTKRGMVAASASADGSVKLWDIRKDMPDGEASPYAVLNGHSRGINEVAWHKSSPLLSTASDDKTMKLWDAVTAEAIVEFRGHDNFVFCMDHHQHLLVSGSFDETVRLWDTRTGDLITTLPAHSDPVTGVSFNRDGTCICSASHDGLIRIWDVATGECLKTIYAAGNPPVSSVRYSPNGRYILAGTLDSKLRLWPAHQTGKHKCSKTYMNSKEHINTKYSVASDFMHNGNIVTGSENGKVIIYDLQSRQVEQVLPSGSTEPILAVSSHDKEPFLACGGMSSDCKVDFWAPHGFLE